MTRCVVTIHGLIRTPISLLYANSRLRRAGYDTLSYGYPSTKLPLADQAKRLHLFLQKNLAPDTELNFLTHSLGSIVVRLFAAEFGSQYKLRRIVMLGPPNQGAQAARIVRKVPFSQKILGPVLKELCDLDLPPATDLLEVGVIAGATNSGRGYAWFLKGNNDGIVTVDETKLHGAKDHITMPGLHSIMMYYPSILAQAIHFLDHGKFKRQA